MMKPTSFDEAFQILDRAIDSQEEPTVHQQLVVLGTFGRTHFNDAMVRFERRAKENPLLFLGAAVAVLGLAFLLSRSGRRP